MKPPPPVSKKKNKIDRVRYESFGGIISSRKPPFLAWVDKDYMREIGYESSTLWSDTPEEHHLSAPTEVHASLTNSCPQYCNSCYMNSVNSFENELTTQEWKRHLKTLRDMGVFHVALGGGEAFERNDFGELVAFCKAIGLVPNLTTSGQSIKERDIAICTIMGQVNVSFDGIGRRYSINGRHGSFKKADLTVKMLKKAGVQVGINCVVSQKNFYSIQEIVKYAVKRGLNEIEFLKYKPSGRGKLHYKNFMLTQEMIRKFYPLVIDFSERFNIEIKIDCSFIPAMVYHNPPLEMLQKTGVSGCDGGNVLLSVRSNGTFSGCSFVKNNEPVSDIANLWKTSQHLRDFRNLVNKAKAPCGVCEYLPICRCGCRAVSLYTTGDFFAPDPECPRVYDYQTKMET